MFLSCLITNCYRRTMTIRHSLIVLLESVYFYVAVRVVYANYQLDKTRKTIVEESLLKQGFSRFHNLLQTIGLNLLAMFFLIVLPFFIFHFLRLNTTVWTLIFNSRNLWIKEMKVMKVPEWKQKFITNIFMVSDITNFFYSRVNTSETRQFLGRLECLLEIVEVVW